MAPRKNTSGLKWVEGPPARGRGWSESGKYLTYAEELKANPGQWAILPFTASTSGRAYTMAHHIRHGNVLGFKEKGVWEAVGRRNDDGSGTVYVRYTGKTRTRRK